MPENAADVPAVDHFNDKERDHNAADRAEFRPAEAAADRMEELHAGKRRHHRKQVPDHTLCLRKCHRFAVAFQRALLIKKIRGEDQQYRDRKDDRRPDADGAVRGHERVLHKTVFRDRRIEARNGRKRRDLRKDRKEETAVAGVGPEPGGHGGINESRKRREIEVQHQHAADARESISRQHHGIDRKRVGEHKKQRIYQHPKHARPDDLPCGKACHKGNDDPQRGAYRIGNEDRFQAVHEMGEEDLLPGLRQGVHEIRLRLPVQVPEAVVGFRKREELQKDRAGTRRELPDRVLVKLDVQPHLRRRVDDAF